MLTLFELHLTTTELDEAQLTEFVAFCDTIAAKPILIELPEGIQQQQPMISKVVRCVVPDEIHEIIETLQASFTEAGFPVKRVKVEVPPDQRREAEKAFPNFLGGYYEWHGRVNVSDKKELLTLCRMTGAHLSANALKNKPEERIITIRGAANERGFQYRVGDTQEALFTAFVVAARDAGVTDAFRTATPQQKPISPTSQDRQQKQVDEVRRINEKWYQSLLRKLNV